MNLWISNFSKPTVFTKNATKSSFDYLMKNQWDVNKEFLPLFNFTNCPTSQVPDRFQLKCHAIILDYDDGDVTFDSFVDQKHQFYYWIYTTSTNSKAKSKFRVVIPLSKWWDAESITTFVKYKFSQGADQSQTAQNRRFYAMSKFDKDGSPTRHGIHKGEYIDRLEDIKATVEFYNFLSIEDNFTHTHSGFCDCSKFDNVIKYLETSFPNVRGNGGASRNGLFSSICACVKYNDEETLNKVIEKAKSEYWTDKEIDQIIDKAEVLASEK